MNSLLFFAVKFDPWILRLFVLLNLLIFVRKLMGGFCLLPLSRVFCYLIVGVCSPADLSLMLFYCVRLSIDRYDEFLAYFLVVGEGN